MNYEFYIHLQYTKIIKAILRTGTPQEVQITHSEQLLPFIRSVRSLHLICNLNRDRLLVSVMSFSVACSIKRVQDI